MYGVALAGAYTNEESVHYLTTGPLDRTGYERIRLRFWRWLGVDGNGFDSAVLEASSNGTDWVGIWQNPETPLQDTAWQPVAYDLAAVEGGDSLTLRWGMGPCFGVDAYSGWNLDDIELCGVRRDALRVTPESDWASQGFEGGAFDPGRACYAITNSGEADLAWTAAASGTWLTVEPSGGSLAGGDSVMVTVSVNAAAGLLPPGVYSNAVAFSNTASGVARTRTAALTVRAIPGSIVILDSIPPANDTNLPFGYTVAGSVRVEQVTLTNADAVHPLTVSAITVRLNGGLPVFETRNSPAIPAVIPPLGVVTFDVAYAPSATGMHQASVAVASDDLDQPEVSMPLSGECVLDTLRVDPETPFESRGHPGGPFVPVHRAYGVIHWGTGAAPWQAWSTQAWLSVEPPDGVLTGASSAAVTATVGAAAAALPEGVYRDTLRVSNAASGVVQSREIVLTVSTSARLQLAPASFEVTNVLGQLTVRSLSVGNAPDADAALAFDLEARQLGAATDMPLSAPGGSPAPDGAAGRAGVGFARAAGVPGRAGRLLVRFDPDLDRPLRAAQRAPVGAGVVEREYGRVPGLCRVRLEPGQPLEAALDAWRRVPGVRYAEPDVVRHIEWVPNDARFGELWGLHNTGQTGGTPDADVDAPEAWNLETGRTNVIVAVIDTGVEYAHEDLAQALWRNPGEIPGNGLDDDGNGYVDDVFGINAVTDSGDPLDDHGHGTHCAGTLGARGNNGTGVAGVCWAVRIMALKSFDADGHGSDSDAIECIDFAVGMGARVISASWGGGEYGQALKDAIEAAGASGVVFCAAAGNDGANNDLLPHYPSSYDLPGILSVMATDHRDMRASYSCYGPVSVDLAAPGSSILSCRLGGGYRLMSGTSMATPHVAGACALLLAAQPGLSVARLRAVILDSVDVPAVPLSCVSGGRLNVARALRVAGGAWLDADPTGATNVAPGESVAVSVAFDAGDFPPGRYTGELALSANDLFVPWTNVPAVMVILPDALGVQPAAGIESDGLRGGPFAPDGAVYRVTNAGPGTLAWSASWTQDWLAVSPAAGVVPAGGAAAVTVTVNAAAARLAPGTYADRVAFSNGASGAVVRRSVRLEVSARPPDVFLAIPLESDPGWTRGGQWAFGPPQGRDGDPASGHTGTNVYGYNLAGAYSNVMPAFYLTAGPFDASRHEAVAVRFRRWLGVERSGYARATVEASSNGADWVTLWENPAANLQDTVWQPVSYDLPALADGCPTLYLRWGMGPNQALYTYSGWNLDDLELTGRLIEPLGLAPAAAVTAEGPAGGPFTPGGREYGLSNACPETIEWVAVHAQRWVTVTPPGGRLAPGASARISVTLNESARSLAPGAYGDEVVFTDLMSGKSRTRAVHLTVTRKPQSIAFPAIPDAVVTSRVVLAAAASSWLPVTYAVQAGPARLAGGALSFGGTGRVRVAADQAGDALWAPALTVVREFTVWPLTGPVAGVPGADFDGDRLADPAVYDARNGAWSVRLSSSGYALYRFAGLLGGPEFVSAAADYDGDRLCDPCVYHEAGGTWNVLLSGSGYPLLERTGFLGGPGWAPAPSDFEGDRQADYAVYETRTGDWIARLSRSGYARIHVPCLLGRPGGCAVPADYDGDGLADPAVYERGDGSWTVGGSASGYAPIRFRALLGGPDWAPVPADYDGDGRADPAVLNPVTGAWRVLLSGSGYPRLDLPAFLGALEPESAP